MTTTGLTFWLIFSTQHLQSMLVYVVKWKHLYFCLSLATVNGATEKSRIFLFMCEESVKVRHFSTPLTKAVHISFTLRVNVSSLMDKFFAVWEQNKYSCTQTYTHIDWMKYSAFYRFPRISRLCRSWWTPFDVQDQTPEWPCTLASAILSAPPAPDREEHGPVLNHKIKKQTKRHETNNYRDPDREIVLKHDGVIGETSKDIIKLWGKWFS